MSPAEQFIELQLAASRHLLKVEWSCKASPNAIDGDRWVLCLSPKVGFGKSSPLRRLASRAKLEPPGLGRESWFRLLEERAQQTFVGYVGASRVKKTEPGLKFYLGFRETGSELYENILRAQLPALPRRFPNAPAIFMLGHEGSPEGWRPRAYVLFDREELAKTSVRNYLASVLGPDLAKWLRGQIRAGFVMGADGNVRLLIGTRPGGREGEEPPAGEQPWAGAVDALARRAPFFEAARSRMTWISATPDIATRSFPSELNVYVKL